jgi:hypothetical protein
MAKEGSVFKFQMATTEDNIKFYLEDHHRNTTNSFQLDFVRAKRLFLMLDPKFLGICLECPIVNMEFFRLIAMATGKFLSHY